MGDNIYSATANCLTALVTVRSTSPQMLSIGPGSRVWGGGGVLSLEKGTDCGPTAGERWLSRLTTAKRGGGGGGSPSIIL